MCYIRDMERSGIVLVLLSSLLLISCGKRLEKQIQDQVRTAAGARLDRSSVEVVEVRQSGESAVAEIVIRTAVRMRKKGGDWVLEEIRLGDRKWEKVDRIIDSLESRRSEATLEEMGQIVAAIKGYTVQTGKAPEVEGFEALIDVLSPSFLASVIRTDAWTKPFTYKRLGLLTYELRSAGPDGILDTEDDLVTGEK